MTGVANLSQATARHRLRHRWIGRLGKASKHVNANIVNAQEASRATGQRRFDYPKSTVVIVDGLGGQLTLLI
jgi:hypothetical protein